ncbi:hypothetical protein GCM10007874_46310 [Labrys miyagiensis]|uniref:Uncharacterized protein n=1 Tax=Labrys miyagiensis TaxID=346912 RepID=A0ABQ6CSB0_9HYPH|nr:hypothetical protein [Labrys miyagiensis]GLS21614.1 hypothetical protein GCM10007874_46310 [Labrys miyagiensis]
MKMRPRPSIALNILTLLVLSSAWGWAIYSSAGPVPWLWVGIGGLTGFFFALYCWIYMEDLLPPDN